MVPWQRLLSFGGGGVACHGVVNDGALDDRTQLAIVIGLELGQIRLKVIVFVDADRAQRDGHLALTRRRSFWLRSYRLLRSRFDFLGLEKLRSLPL